MDIIEKIAAAAGEEILRIYNDQDQNWEIKGKEDGSPLTIADDKANDIICRMLKENFPEVPIISEENKEIPYSERSGYKKYWLVDPLDGTKEFIKRNGEFTVNIALIEDNRPVKGVVYAPVLDEMYFAAKEKGAFIRIGGESSKITAAEYYESEQGLKIVCSRSHLNDDTQNFLRKYREPRQVSMGSSLKFMLIAKGDAEVYPRLAPTMEWDTAASQIIVEEAGGEVIDWKTGQPMTYNKENLRNNYFVAFGKRKPTL